ncbi:hypothetical protein QVD17_38418 [Tagetes erecta]|uniref:Uncharacterized protein n=1 Tax=Tagetes erecta TaxID=13708 RepID=A0AAD8JS44_TARER|nr:hypothetical protein QVD17_38418 [Tagetes erecta]
MEFPFSTETGAHGAISSRDVAPLHSTGAKLQIFVFTLLLHRIAFLGLLGIIRIRMTQENHSAFELNRVFMIIAIAALFAVEVVCGVLFCRKIYLHPSMKDNYYTILTCIGSFSAFVAPFSLVMVLVLPLERNWIGYLLMCLFFGIIVACFHFDDLQQDKRSPVPTFNYSGLVLVPLSLLFVLFVPQNLNWIVYSVIYLSLGLENVYIFINYFKYINEEKHKVRKSQKLQQVIQQYKNNQDLLDSTLKTYLSDFSNHANLSR